MNNVSMILGKAWKWTPMLSIVMSNICSKWMRGGTDTILPHIHVKSHEINGLANVDDDMSQMSSRKKDNHFIVGNLVHAV